MSAHGLDFTAAEGQGHVWGQPARATPAGGRPSVHAPHPESRKGQAGACPAHHTASPASATRGREQICLFGTELSEDRRAVQISPMASEALQAPEGPRPRFPVPNTTQSKTSPSLFKHLKRLKIPRNFNKFREWSSWALATSAFLTVRLVRGRPSRGLAQSRCGLERRCTRWPV